MKIFLTKIFALFCGIIFLAQGIALLQIYFGKLHPQAIINLFNWLVSQRIHLQYLLGISIGFIIFGLIFLRMAARKKHAVLDAITINKKGEIIRIPAESIKEVVQQIISLNSNFKDVEIDIRKIKNWINIDLYCAYEGNESIPAKINEMKEILKGEMKRAFDFHYMRINFQLDGVTLKHSREEQEGEEGLENDLGEDTGSDLNSVSDQSESPEEKEIQPAAKTKKPKKMPWEK